MCIGVIIMFPATLLLYLPASVLGYYLYGIELTDSLLNSLPYGGLRSGAEVAISAHALFAVLLYINPAMQSFEGLIGIDGGKRTRPRALDVIIVKPRLKTTWVLRPPLY